MRILYISRGDHVDYLDDCLSIGLKELLGTNVIDCNKRSHIYTSYDPVAASSLYGMGMTVTRVLPDPEIDRTDIANKIRNRYFDLVVFGSIWRCAEYFEEVLGVYSRSRVIAVDGEDEPFIHKALDFGVPYFKRELVLEHERLFPISFAMPTAKVNTRRAKTRDVAVCDPRDKATYIYKTEAEYYSGYGQARFGVTMRKSGWDCMRHYEILGNGCLPYFIGVEQCPHLTMVNFPKAECAALNQALETGQSPEAVYERSRDAFLNRLNNALTTKAMATKFLDTVIRFNRG